MSSLRAELQAPTLEQAVKNYRKVVRAAIRLRKSIEADNLLAEVMPTVEVYLAGQLQQGVIPSLTLGDIEAMLDETP